MNEPLPSSIFRKSLPRASNAAGWQRKKRQAWYHGSDMSAIPVVQLAELDRVAVDYRNIRKPVFQMLSQRPPLLHDC
ncbi:MAG: hypothetical protein KKA54_20755 [Proteobacteria bacterium]|nr:hypothetical protein [Pseudomonadota bacterium]